MAAKMQKLAFVAFLLALIVSGGEAGPEGADHWDKHSKDKFLKCSHYCEDRVLTVCIANKCVPLPYGKVHNYCHVGCEAKHLVCKKKCLEH